MLARLARRRNVESPHAPSGLHSIRDFRRAAKLRMDAVAFDYFSSGADGQRLMRRNRLAWDEIEIRHRVLVDVSAVDTTTELLGLKLPFPALIAPMAYQRLAHEDGELATARAAAETGVPLIVSTMANVTLEEIAAATGAPKWFQLYCHRDRAITEDLIKRAEAAGYGALVVTVDAPVLGRRLADERNGFDLPQGLTRANLDRYEGSGSLSQGEQVPALHPDPSHLAELFRTRQDASLTWKDIDWFMSLTKLPILLKGIVRGDDAKRAADAGCAGVIVSNHGGRQLDASIASARALPEVVAAVEDRIPVLVDGSIEWGADILRALALGAKAVLIGRPILWGLAVGGEAGVKRVLNLYAEDFKRAMQLAGCASVQSVAADLLAGI
ncbi:MAG: alpha-hydroxy-acid oxidizing protein [Planctomycetes bacterium]|nr:alpha-hydroxy-acid oxidizing protein [Planctomycetota bacterium]